jgi:hypothetical protein
VEDGGDTPRQTGDSATPDAGALLVIDPSVASITIQYVDLGTAYCFSPYLPVTYDRVAHVMTWPPCPADSGFDAPDPGPDAGGPARMLSASEAQSVEKALAALTYVNDPTCGGEDGDEYYLTTYDAAGHAIRLYSGGAINCTSYPEAAGIQAVYDLFVQLHG